MSIVHIHIERTGGVSVQNIYAKRYHGVEMLWYSTRDGLFAPFNIFPGNYAKDWQLKLHVFIAERFPILRRLILKVRAWRRKRSAVKPEDLSRKAKVIVGHFTAAQMLRILPAKENAYRVIIREPLERMWSHYYYWRKHKGDVGHMVVPAFREDMTFEEFALLPEMQNYQTKAVGRDLSIYDYIGTIEGLRKFALDTKLLNPSDPTPCVNHFSDELPELNRGFLEQFKEFHAEDYQLYYNIKSRE